MVLLVKVWIILELLPWTPPETAFSGELIGRSHVNIVPSGNISELVRLFIRLKDWFVHITNVLSEIIGFGSIVNVKSIDSPTQSLV